MMLLLIVREIIPDDDEDTATFVIEEADLELTKVVDNASPNIGEDVVFTIAVSNTGPDTATNVEVMEQLPIGYTYVSDNSGGDYDSVTGIWTVGSVTTVTPVALEITVTVNAPTGAANEYLNVAEITASDQYDTDSDPDSDSTITPQTSDLSIEKVVDNPTPNVGEDIVFTISVSNAGTSTATGVTVLEQLPSGYTYVSDNSGGTYDEPSGVWTVGSVPTGAPTELEITVTVNAPTGTAGEYLNVAEITASDQYDPDSDPTSDSSTDDNGDGIDDDDETTEAIIIQQADLSIVKAIDNPSPNVGETVIFTLTITNAGPDVATGVAISDIVPNGYTIGTINDGGSITTGTTIDWTGLIVPANNGIVTVSYEAEVLAPVAGVVYTNNAEISASDQYDPDSDPDSDNGTDDMGDGIDDDDETTITPIIRISKRKCYTKRRRCINI